jgi:N-acetylglucosamine-6-phosphate deacetylase
MYIDFQVNGYAGVDFTAQLVTPEDMEKVADMLIAHNVSTIFPTVVTDDMGPLCERLVNMRKIIDASPRLKKLMPAFHVEGPCLLPEDGYKGAHPAECMIPATPDTLKRIVDACGGPDRTALITIAPEVDPGFAGTQYLVSQGIKVSAGHTNASRDTLYGAVKEGLSLFTHLGNGCASVMPRHDNIINRALSIPQLTLCFIPDGIHIPFWVLPLWLKVAGLERTMFTTDCMAAAGGPLGTYKIGRWTLEVGPDKVVRPAGKTHLAGSALTMPEAYDNAINKLGLTPAQAKALCHDNAKKVFARWLK